ncbi:hypothetical protein L202_01857 [Cryptococcus amylolentus CBS 6039]|uniref:Uncharacterized protein n=1 Tax=Cryptococcus amylolentus CBS 6039 TaxID=1295533 RepID=A0A1E3HZ04_9TREE|nr:hypothetical protein L202_01857 [Cryptococcus amylolentus CBS 6039]ODN81425.1 hypothetical protein L202_01857 [Cryptococcus amylolentus CBS 6039]
MRFSALGWICETRCKRSLAVTSRLVAEIAQSPRGIKSNQYSRCRRSSSQHPSISSHIAPRPSHLAPPRPPLPLPASQGKIRHDRPFGHSLVIGVTKAMQSDQNNLMSGLGFASQTLSYSESLSQASYAPPPHGSFALAAPTIIDQPAPQQTRQNPRRHGDAPLDDPNHVVPSQSPLTPPPPSEPPVPISPVVDGVARGSLQSEVGNGTSQSNPPPSIHDIPLGDSHAVPQDLVHGAHSAAPTVEF